jgi:LysM repeat protein
VPQEPISTPDNGQASTEPVEVQAPTPVPLEPTAEPLTETTYIVVAGDTLFKIALEHDVTVDDIAAANGIIDINSLEVGQQLQIPGPGTSGTAETEDTGQELIEETETEAETETDAVPATPAATAGGVHVVKPGENLFRIGLQYGCSVEQLARHNGITTPNRISVGMEVQIPACN